jgi:hypothetical protein
MHVTALLLLLQISGNWNIATSPTDVIQSLEIIACMPVILALY